MGPRRDRRGVALVERTLAHARGRHGAGAEAGLALIDELEAGGALEGHHRLAAGRTTSLPEQRYLAARAARL